MNKNLLAMQHRLSEDEIKGLKGLERIGKCNQSKQWPFFTGIDLFA